MRELFGLHWLAQGERDLLRPGRGREELVRRGPRPQRLPRRAWRALHQGRQAPAGPAGPRADHSVERELRAWLAPDLLILDDFGLRKLPAQESSDLYDVLVERDGRAATIITSNRAVEEWVALFDDPILANSALDRFAHRAHQIVMEGPSLRAARALRSAQGRAAPVKSPILGDSQLWVASSNALLGALRPSRSARAAPRRPLSTLADPNMTG